MVSLVTRPSRVARSYVAFRANPSPLRSELGEVINLVRDAVSPMNAATSGALAAAGVQAGINIATGLAKSCVGLTVREPLAG